MFKSLSLALLLLFSTSIPAHSVDAPESFTFTGAGYGHGVGMSQIGAKAKALAGESATAILNYYYKDVVIAPIVDTQTIRVNIGHALKAATFTAPSDGAISYSIGETSSATASTSKKKLQLSVNGNWAQLGELKAQKFFITWSKTISLTQSSGTSTYKYGFIAVKVVNGGLEITTTLNMHDEYLLGISEVSSAWPAAALEAQVIASRSYALSKLGPLRGSCDCHVYSHISDQNFVGYSKEIEPKIGKFWRAAVLRTDVDSSTSLALLQGGKPIQAYYSSSTGGATQTTQDAWGSPTSYTQSVSDSASVDVKLNPRFASWKATSSQGLVAAAFSLPDVVSLEVITRNTAGAVTSIKATSSNGLSKILRGDTFRSRAKLPSAWFSLTS